MAISVVQSKQPTITTGSTGGGSGTGAFAGTSCSLTFNSSTTTGNTIVVLVGNYYTSGTGSAVAIADNKGNTYTRSTRGIRSGNPDSCEIWYCANATGGATHTISYAGNPSNYGEYAIYELSGVDTTTPVSIARAGNDAASLPSNAGTVTFNGAATSTAALPSITAPDADCFWAVVVAPPGTPVFSGSPTGSISSLSGSYYSDYATSNNAIWGGAVIAGSSAQVFTVTAGNGSSSTSTPGWCAVAFKPAAGGGGTTAIPLPRRALRTFSRRF